MAITSVYLRFTNVKNTQTDALETLNITNDDICPGGLVISKSSTTSDSIEIGAAVAGEIEITLRNADEKYSKYNFEDSTLYCNLGNVINDDNSNSEVYYIDNVERVGSKLRLLGYSSIIKFDEYVDEDFSFVDSDNNPLTVEALLNKIKEKFGIYCGVLFSDSFADNLEYEIKKPDSNKVTYRQLLSWCAQILCTNCASYQKLIALMWYTDYYKPFEQVSITPSNRYSSTLKNEIEITGVYFYDSNGNEYYAGKDRTAEGFKEYALTINGNELVNSNTADSMLSVIWSFVQGFKFSPFEATVIPNVPIRNMFPLYKTEFTDKNGKQHTVAVTDYVYTLNRALQLGGKGVSQTEKSYIAADAFTQEQTDVLKKGLIGYKIGDFNIGKSNRYPNDSVIYKSDTIEGVGYEVGIKATFGSPNYANYYVAKKENGEWRNVLWINNKGELTSDDGTVRTVVGSGEISFLSKYNNNLTQFGLVKAAIDTKADSKIPALCIQSSSNSTGIAISAASDSYYIMYRVAVDQDSMATQIKHLFHGKALFKGILCCGDSIYTAKNFLIYKNDQYLYGKTTDGTSQRLIGISSANNVVVGHTSNVGNLKILAKSNKTISLEAGTVKANDTTLATGSDARIKNSITGINEKYEKFFGNLRPVTFRYNNGQSGRRHVGFIAQEVLQALEKSGLTSQDFAGYVRAESDTEGLDGYELLIRYSEFTALNTFMIQKLLNEINRLKERINQ